MSAINRASQRNHDRLSSTGCAPATLRLWPCQLRVQGQFRPGTDLHFSKPLVVTRQRHSYFPLSCWDSHLRRGLPHERFINPNLSTGGFTRNGYSALLKARYTGRSVRLPGILYDLKELTGLFLSQLEQILHVGKVIRDYGDSAAVCGGAFLLHLLVLFDLTESSSHRL